jgi:hypothetical protein
MTDPDTTTAATSMLSAAMTYSSRGWRVFPADSSGLKKSHKSAEHSNGAAWGKTVDPTEIKNDFQKWPGANIGIATGAESSIFVVEADTPKGHDVNGIASLQELEESYGKLPDTLMAVSPSGSLHYYFRWPSGVAVKNSASKIGPGIDVRGEGGMVIAPPSVRPGKGSYRWLNDHPVADAPQWLLDLATANDATGDRASGEPEADPALVDAALRVIPNDDVGWEDWNKIGMAVWRATGGRGLAAFDEWSKKSKKHDAQQTAEKWATYFKSPPTEIGAGTLFHLASEQNPRWRDGQTDKQQVEIARLAALPLIQYDQQRAAAAERLSIRVGTLDLLVAQARPCSDDVQGQGTRLILARLDPWPSPVDGETLIDDMEAAIRRYVVLDQHQATAVALWVVHTHAIETAEHSPRLHFHSPAHRCGKTTLLKTVTPMVARPIPTENISPSALFRIIELAHPTLLIDEVDSFLNQNEDMRGLLNAGHSRGGQVIRTVGEDFEPRAFSVWAPVLFAGIGRIPETLEDRSITVQLRRRLPNEQIERLRSNRTGHLTDLGRRVSRWVTDNQIALADADPAMPENLGDRERDNWRPLVAIADAICPALGERARSAAIKFAEEEMDSETAAIMALVDVAALFEFRGKDRLASHDLVTDLNLMDDRPWKEWRHGKPMTTNSLARLLRPFGIRAKKKIYEAGPVREAKIRYVDNETTITHEDINEDIRDTPM